MRPSSIIETYIVIIFTDQAGSLVAAINKLLYHLTRASFSKVVLHLKLIRNELVRLIVSHYILIILAW